MGKLKCFICCQTCDLLNKTLLFSHTPQIPCFASLFLPVLKEWAAKVSAFYDE